jgi:hypothetical protein
VRPQTHQLRRFDRDRDKTTKSGIDQSRLLRRLLAVGETKISM